MEERTEVKERKETVLERVPPGDKWTPVSDNYDNILHSLTDALEFWYQETGETKFYMDARKGIVQTVKEETVTVKPKVKSYSLYGEE